MAFTSFLSWMWAISSHLLRAYEKIHYDEQLQLLSNFFTFVSVILTLIFKLSLIEYFLLYSIGLVSIYPLRILKCKQLNSLIDFKFKFHNDVFEDVLKYSLGIFTMGIFQFSVNNLRPIILGIQSNLNNVTDYKILEQIINIIILLSGSFLSIFLPYSSKIKAMGNFKAQEKVVYDGTKYLTVILSLLIFGLISISEPLLDFYVGKEYSNLNFWLSIWALSLLGNHNMAISSLVLSDSNIKSITIYTIFSSIVSISIAWLLTPQLNIGGVITAYFVYVILQMFFYYLYYIPCQMKLSSLKILKNSVIGPVLIGSLCLGVTKTIEFYFRILKPIYSIICFGLFFTAIYFSLIVIFTLKINDIKSLIR
jgi:O-antigen/teichoic acid export membrane protein